MFYAYCLNKDGKWELLNQSARYASAWGILDDYLSGVYGTMNLSCINGLFKLMSNDDEQDNKLVGVVRDTPYDLSKVIEV